MRDSEFELLSWALQGDVAAIDFCTRLGAISQVWDDIQDDGLRGPRVDFAFYEALVVLPAHPFLQQHLASLTPLLESTILDYITSNQFEAGSVHERTLSFVLRDSLTAVVVYCARLVGGFEWATLVAPDVRAYFHDESLADYLRGTDA